MADRPLDILTLNPGPALSATSDMPVLTEEPDAAPPAPEPEAPAVEEPAPEGGEGEAEPEGTEGEAGEVETPAKARTIRGRMSELTTDKKIEIAKREAAEAHAAKLEALLAEALKKPAETPPAPEPPPEPVVEPLPPRPQRANFDSPDAYDEAMDNWYDARAERAITVKLAEQEQHRKSEEDATRRETAAKAEQDGMQTIRDAYQTRVAAVAEEIPDFAEAVARPDLNISLPVAMAIMQSDEGPRAAYHLATHPEIADKIAAMVVPNTFFPVGHQLAGQPVPDAQRQLVELGKIFATVAQAASPAPKPAPPPPAPITPIRGRNQAAVVQSLEEADELSTEEYAALRAQGNDPVARATAARLAFARTH
jgi:hypothetical protein